MQELQAHIRNIPDFPEPGIQFKDITPLLKKPQYLKQATELLVAPFADDNISAVVGMEARGFIFGSLAANLMEVGFVPLRKPGKLPFDVHSASYELEYGSAGLEVHRDALDGNDRVLLIDDLIATGGTALASCQLMENLGAQVVGCAFLIELDDLGGRDRLRGYRVHSLVHF